MPLLLIDAVVKNSFFFPRKRKGERRKKRGKKEGGRMPMDRFSNPRTKAASLLTAMTLSVLLIRARGKKRERGRGKKRGGVVEQTKIRYHAVGRY